MKHEIRMGIRDLRTGQILRVSRPLPAVGELFTLPPRHTVVWKYGDYYKFRDLFLKGQLYFRRADQLPDIYEGRFTPANQRQRSKMFADAFADLGLGNSPDILAIQESHRNRVFLNCWHKNRFESPRMWREYTSSSDSVVLISSVKSLAAALGTQCQAANVHYVRDDEPLPELHSLAALVHKRHNPYFFENELRLIHQLPPTAEVYLDQPQDYYRLISCCPSILVEELRFHPAASAEFKSKVRADVANAGLAFPACDSHLTSKW